MKPVIVIGFGGFGREVEWLARDCGREVLGYLDDATAAGKNGAYTVLGSIDSWADYPDADFVIAIGNPRIRRMVAEKLEQAGCKSFATLVHPSVKMGDSVKIGEGCMVCAGTIMTVDLEIGNHAILNLNVTVGHDVKIKNYVTVAPMVALSGNVVLEDGAEVGTGASIRQGVTLNKGGMLGMGGVLTKDTEANKIYVGSPAKPLKSLPDFV